MWSYLEGVLVAAGDWGFSAHYLYTLDPGELNAAFLAGLFLKMNKGFYQHLHNFIFSYQTIQPPYSNYHTL
jgi:hypothetical protein